MGARVAAAACLAVAGLLVGGAGTATAGADSLDGGERSGAEVGSPAEAQGADNTDGQPGYGPADSIDRDTESEFDTEPDTDADDEPDDGLSGLGDDDEQGRRAEADNGGGIDGVLEVDTDVEADRDAEADSGVEDAETDDIGIGDTEVDDADVEGSVGGELDADAGLVTDGAEAAAPDGAEDSDSGEDSDSDADEGRAEDCIGGTFPWDWLWPWPMPQPEPGQAEDHSTGSGGPRGNLPAGPPALRPVPAMEPPEWTLPTGEPLVPGGPDVIDVMPGVGAQPGGPLSVPIVAAPFGAGPVAGPAPGAGSAPAAGGGAFGGLPASPRQATAEPPSARPPLPAGTGTNSIAPASSYRVGYGEYLRTAGTPQVAVLAVPGLAGILVLTGVGGLVGYRQAKASHAVRTSGIARFT